jgi:cell division protein FtsI (penicillin-binding protein 3)
VVTNNNTNTRKAMLIRTGVVFAGMFLFGTVIVMYLFKIQVTEGSRWIALADSLSTREVNLDPVRGNIFDCNGNLLATSVPIYDVRIDGRATGFTKNENLQQDLDSLSYFMAAEFKDKTATAYKDLFKKVTRTGNRYYLLKSKINFRQMQNISKFPIFRLGKYKGGFLTTERTKREKPFGFLAERTIGFRQALDGSEKNIIKVGLEGSFDKYLGGKKGKQLMQRIAGGTYIPISDESTIDAQQGKDIFTTIDINLQDVAENSLLNTLIENDAEWGTAILMEVSTGEIKALANLTKVSEGKYTEKFNYAIGERMEPGSTMKLVSMMALLEDGHVKPTDHVDAENGEKLFCTSTMRDSHLGTGVVSMQEAFEHSSNVAFGKQVTRFYQKNPQQFYDHIAKVNLTKRLDLQIEGEPNPFVLVPNDPAWSCTTLPWMSIGYEISFTPLQVLSVYNAIANNGKLMRPLLVKSVSNAGTLVKSYQSQVIVEHVCSEQTAKQLRAMMEGVVTRGTASSLKSDFYSYAGKTGTAVIAKGRQGYTGGAGKLYRASFCGYFPADQPRYSCFVLISEPRKENYYAAKVALPVFKEIADKVYATSLNLHKELKFATHFSNSDLPPINKAFTDDLKLVLNEIGISNHLHNDSITEEESIWAKADIQDKSIALQPLLHTKGMVPDVKGMGLRDAMFLLESKGLTVRVKGAGKVIRQSIQPGTPLGLVKVIQIQLGKA